MNGFLRGACVAALTALAAFAHADEAAIRKNLAERFPKSLKQIDEVSKTPMAGLWEVRVDNDVFYTDDQGQFLIQGNLIDTKTATDLTAARVAKLTAIDPSTLPLNDAIVVKQGSGARKMYVFADPNCGYCKRFERDMLQIKDVTMYTFLIPILGGDSPEKSRNIWCAKNPSTAWRDWMTQGVSPTRAMGACNTGALERNLALARKHKVQGTPTVIFPDGHRVPGAMGADDVEKALAEVGKKG